MALRFFLLHLIKQKVLLKTFLTLLKTLILMTLPVFPSRTNLKLHNIFVTSKLVEKVITNPDSSESSVPHCIPVMVLKNCEPELSYILAEFFSKCGK